MKTLLRHRDERGATAILFGLMALVLLGAGAFAVDLGQVYAKRSALQSNVDMAVMAAAAELDSGGACNAEVINAATQFLTKAGNEVADQTAVNLADGGDGPADKDGFIRCDNWRVDLWAPTSHVDFGLARAITDKTGVDVPAHAAAQIKSPSRNSSLPMFGVDGCDYGAQTIRDDSGPTPPAPPVPPLTPTSATFNDATFTVSPDNAPAGTTSLAVTLTGTNLDGATAVGFTGAGGPPDHHEVPEAEFVSASATEIQVNVPAEVLAVEDVWFVRVLKGTDWSPESEAQRFTVGDKLYCLSSSEGNFGTLDVPRTDTSHVLEWNIILGMMPELAIHPSPSGECGGDPAPTVESKTVPVDGTNCLATEPGVKIAAANDGLISGKGGKLGRLDKDSTSNCSRNGTSSRTPTTIKSKYINDDILTCFIINEARIQDLVAGNALGTAALSAAIFDSPRFFWIPIVDSDPSTGKKSWPIIDFRPGFITDQAMSSTNTTPGTISAHNGLEAAPSGLRRLDVVLFHEDALPEFAPASGGEIDYTGSGTKVIVLVD